ncbi:MAG TPA: sugar phosphate isomerase/epimerase [Anaerolineales bacterium]|nr:sugar phosphate isomerase/epimerase [Anaerolineae bacterium]HIQ01610.1 sugar phosphate isomerase/epimerase [Anaerolineales bacterium]
MIILSTGSIYNYGTDRVFALAAEVGFDGVEVLIDNRWDTRQPAYLRQLSTAHDLPIIALHSPFVADVQGWPSDQLGRLKRTVALAQELEVPLVITHLPFRFHGILGYWHGPHPRRFLLPIPWPRREPYYYFLQNGHLQRMEATSGVTIAVENMPAHRLLGQPVSIAWFNRPEELTRFPHLTLDTTHIGTWGLEPVEVYETLKEHIAHVHLSNFDGKEHRSPPDGRLRLAELLRRMAHDGYRGAISVESGPDALDAEDEGKCRTALKRALEFCREHFTIEM